MQTSLFKKYAQVEAAYRKAEEARNALRAQIVEELTKEELDTFQTPYGTFTRAVKLTYEYPEPIKKREENLKIAKQKAVEKGTANVKTTTEYLRFSEPRE